MLRQAQQEREGPSTLSDVVLRLAACRTDGDLARLLDGGVRQFLGAEAVMLVSRDPDRAAPGGHAGPDLDEPGAVPTANRQLAAIIEAGQPLSMDPSDDRLSGLRAPSRTRRAEIVPSARTGSLTALCIFWRSGQGAPAGRTDETVTVLAAMAGMALERLAAIRREGRERAHLQNRVRNVASIIRSVSSRSAEQAESLEDYVMHFEGRLDALVRSQVALARSRAGRLDFEDLLRDELLAEGIQDGPRVELAGLPVSLVAAEAEALALAIHELAVNAVKFGPFTDRGGRLSVRWWAESTSGRVSLQLDWHEICNKPLDRLPERIGFGRQFLERAIPYELGAETNLTVSPCEVVWRIGLPLHLPLQRA